MDRCSQTVTTLAAPTLILIEDRTYEVPIDTNHCRELLCKEGGLLNKKMYSMFSYVNSHEFVPMNFISVVSDYRRTTTDGTMLN